MNLQFFKFHFLLLYLCSIPFLFAQQGIGTNQPNPSSALEISSQDKGVLIPRMTTTLRDAIDNPALGLMVFNTTTLCLEINTSSNTLAPMWECMGTGQRIITSLACYAVTVSGSIFTGKAANAEISIPYGGGDASSYAGGTTISSGQALGAAGLTATLQAGTLNTGTGLLTYTVSGTMATSGNAYFDISFGGQHCVLVVPVNDSSSGGTAVVSSWDCAGTATGTLYMGQIPNGVTKTVYANVTQAGSYNIKAVSNGVTYSASGNFAGAGNNIEVVLVATGIPVAAGTTSFTLDTDPNCSFDSAILDGSSGGTATVSNWDCNGTSTGSLTLGLAVSGVTQEITANVSTTGTYDLTATANGITFTASGTFFGTGLQTITLTATGTPTAIGTHSYTLSTTPGCSFDRTTTLDPSSGGSAAVEAWDCSGTATGSSTIGVSSAGHTKTITASVTTAGSYNVSASANGVTYSAAGTFTVTGTQTVTLTATGVPIAGGTATYTLSTTPGCSFNTFTTHPSSGGSALVSSWNCSGTSTGTPTVGLPASGITQEITATVSTTGTYDVTATANGITFTASGTFTVTGLQTITLTATGTPTAIGTHSYTLSTTPDCSFDRTTVVDPSSGGSAVVDAWDCTGAATGSSTVGISSAGNTKTITASVTTAGSYNVSATANGVTYSAAGSFAGIGAQSVVLTATGTPTAGGTATYTLSTTPNCSFNIETTDLSSGGSAAVTAWNCNGTSTGTPTVGLVASGITQEITATVSTKGTYDLTATANGLTFTASGTFAGTGLQTITLTATGTPTASGTHSYTLSTTPGCSFDRTTISVLPTGVTITPAEAHRFIVSLYDTDYKPYTAPTAGVSATTAVLNAGGVSETVTLDHQGVLDASGIVVTLEINNSNGTPTLYYAQSKTVTVGPELIEGGGSPIDVTISYPGGTAPVGISTISATISAASTLNIKKLDLNTGLGGDNMGVLLANFGLESNGGLKTTAIDVRIIPGIPDRKFGDGTHDFLYYPIANNGGTWLSNNLGAHYADVNHASFDISKQAAALDDYLAYGSLYQWGRYSDGHELLTWTSSKTVTAVNGTTPTRAGGDTVGHSNFITSNDWRSTPNNDLWKDGGTNNPCPNGYHVPSQAEYDTEIASWGALTAAGAYASPLKYSNTGLRGTGGGFFANDASVKAFGWTSTFSTADSNTRAQRLLFNSSPAEANIAASFRGFGFFVRCIKD